MIERQQQHPSCLTALPAELKYANRMAKIHAKRSELLSISAPRRGQTCVCGCHGAFWGSLPGENACGAKRCFTPPPKHMLERSELAFHDICYDVCCVFSSIHCTICCAASGMCVLCCLFSNLSRSRKSSGASPRSGDAERAPTATTTTAQGT